MNDSIKKMLRITEKDLMITEVSYETLQKKKTLVVDAVLSPTPRACRSCGSTVVDGNGKAINPHGLVFYLITDFVEFPDYPLWEIFISHDSLPFEMNPVPGLKVILSNPDIQSQIMLDIKLLLY
ncbi:hypothetical protein EfmGK941_14480 [Enterococcus faecium]|nr:hypothetical protein EfmGK941_14480 [Enterococcus faecium]